MKKLLIIGLVCLAACKKTESQAPPSSGDRAIISVYTNFDTRQIPLNITLNTEDEEALSFKYQGGNYYTQYAVQNMDSVYVAASFSGGSSHDYIDVRIQFRDKLARQQVYGPNANARVRLILP